MKNIKLFVWKGVNDLQTKADRAAQQYIVQKLKQSFPKVNVIGEEGEDVSESLEGLLSPATTPSEPLFPEILTKAIPDNLRSIEEESVSRNKTLSFNLQRGQS